MDTSNFTLGIDTSYYESGVIDWANAKSHNIQFGVVRCVNGYLKDIWYDRDTSEAKKNNILLGDYHTFYDYLDPKIQAQHYFQNSRKDLDFPPCVDFEQAGTSSNISVNARKASSYVYIREIENLFGYKPIIYTGFYFWKDLWGSSAWGVDYSLWLAQYRNYLPDIPVPWSGWAFWQFSENYSWPNQHADGNYFNGTLDQLKSWLQVYKNTPIPQPIPLSLESLDARLKIVERKLNL
jgi:lysozyme